MKVRDDCFMLSRPLAAIADGALEDHGGRGSSNKYDSEREDRAPRRGKRSFIFWILLVVGVFVLAVALGLGIYFGIIEPLEGRSTSSPTSQKASGAGAAPATKSTSVGKTSEPTPAPSTKSHDIIMDPTSSPKATPTIEGGIDSPEPPTTEGSKGDQTTASTPQGTGVPIGTGLDKKTIDMIKKTLDSGPLDKYVSTSRTPLF